MTDNYKLYRKKWMELTRGGMSPQQADVTAQEYAEECKREYTEINTKINFNRAIFFQSFI